MTTNDNINSTIIASLLLANYYRDDITDRDSLIEYAYTIDDRSTPLRDALIHSIDLDINDALHNMNLDFFLPLPLLDKLSDDDTDELADLFLEHTNPELIADALLELHP